ESSIAIELIGPAERIDNLPGALAQQLLAGPLPGNWPVQSVAADLQGILGNLLVALVIEQFNPRRRGLAGDFVDHRNTQRAGLVLAIGFFLGHVASQSQATHGKEGADQASGSAYATARHSLTPQLFDALKLTQCFSPGKGGTYCPSGPIQECC